MGMKVAMIKETLASLDLRYSRLRSLRLSLRRIALTARLFLPTSAARDNSREEHTSMA
jgi:hypothetical protein